MKKQPSKDLIKRFIGNIKEKDYIKKGDKILVACSGGIDSTVMLDLLYRIKEKYSIELKIVHFNHCIRGKEADRDEEFVRELAKKYNLDVIIGKKNVKIILSGKRFSLEEKARIARYDFFDGMIKKQKFDKVAIGHSADDNAETVIMNFIKGYGFESLKGISEVRSHYIRPIIIFTRNQIIDYANIRNINYVEDSSNKKLDFLRNKIRQKLIPSIKSEFNPNITETLSNWGMLFRSVNNVIEFFVDNTFKLIVKKEDKNKFILDIHKFKDYFVVVRIYILNRVLRELKIYKKGVNQRLIQKIIRLIEKNKIGKTISLSSDYKAVIDRKKLIIFKEFHKSLNIKIKPNEKYVLLDGRIKFESGIADAVKKRFPENDNYWNEMIDYNKIKSNSLILRYWKRGDKFTPLGMTQNKKLSDFFIDEKVPNYFKNNIPLLVSKSEIIWICGYRISNNVKVTKNTKKILCLKCEYN